MRLLARAYNGLITGLAVLAGIVIALALILIAVDVAIRATGFKPPSFTSAAVEYALLYFTMLAAPWLVRRKGHVSVDALVSRLGGLARTLVEKLVYLICVTVSLVFAWYALQLLLDAVASGQFDERSVDIPTWLLYAPMPVGFALVAAEFARYLLGIDSFYLARGELRDSV
jgi:TRAP-type C4-dicarboxylate transport system permease small subunit